MSDAAAGQVLRSFALCAAKLADMSISDLIASVRMLIQMEQKYLRLALPQRSGEDAELIDRAKKLLMAKNHLTEEQAHKFIQKKSMENRSKMSETAQLILATY